MSKNLVNYSMVSTLTKEKNKVLGLSEEQVGCFNYELESGGKKYGSSIHISHFLSGGVYLMIYNGTYVLKPDEVIYLLKDIGGAWK